MQERVTSADASTGTCAARQQDALPGKPLLDAALEFSKIHAVNSVTRTGPQNRAAYDLAT